MGKDIITCKEIVSARESFRAQKEQLITLMDAGFNAMHQAQVVIFLEQMLMSVNVDVRKKLKTHFDWNPETKTNQSVCRVFLYDVYAPSKQEEFSSSELDEINTAWLPFGVGIGQTQEEHGCSLVIFEIPE